VLGDDQRRVAHGIVLLLCLAWAGLGATGIVTAYTTPTGRDGTGGFLFLLAVVGAAVVLVALLALVAGVRALRRFDAGAWRWRRVLAVSGTGSVASLLAGTAVATSLPVLGVLLVLQAVALLGLAALLRPVAAT
jgi:hypothetical protein